MESFLTIFTSHLPPFLLLFHASIAHFLTFPPTPLFTLCLFSMRKNTLILSLPFHSLFLFSTPTPFSYVLYLSLLPFLPLQLFISLLSLLPNTPIFILIHFPSLSFTSFPFLQILSQSPFFLSLSHVLSPLLILLSPVFFFFLFPSFSSFPHSSSFSPLFLFLPLPARRHPPCHPTEGTDYPHLGASSRAPGQYIRDLTDSQKFRIRRDYVAGPSDTLLIW